MWLLLAPLLSALLLNASAAPLHQGYLALVGMLPLLSLHQRSWKQRLLAGWLAGMLTQAIAYYWIFLTIRDFGGVNAPLSALGAVLFWAFQGLDMGIWLWLFPLLSRKGSIIPKPLAAAACWYLLQTHAFPYVFPWVYGSCLVEPFPLGAGAALWTDQGVGFWAIWLQMGIWNLREEGRNTRNILIAMLPLVMLIGGSLGRPKVATETWRVAVVQPNLIPWAKRQKTAALDVFLAHYETSLRLVRQNVDLIIWPETAVPFPLNGATYYENKIRELANASGAAVITGAVERVEKKTFYNSVFLYAPQEQAPQVYRKHLLVPFSEDLPWFLRWALRFVPQLGGFTVGQDNTPFTYKDRQLIPLVCYEALYSDYVNDYRGHLLVNVTNDAWFGKSKASALHLQQIRMRTIENQMPMVRATNSGISCWVDTDGRVKDATPLYEEALPIYEVPVPTELGDRRALWGSRVILALSLLTLLGGILSRRKREAK